MTWTTLSRGRHGAPLRRRQALLLPAALSGAASPSAAPAAGAEAVDLLLVLAVDASGSIDADEFRLHRDGCAGALVYPTVLVAVASCVCRGGTSRRVGDPAEQGSPLRVQGRPGALRPERGADGFIPACAGAAPIPPA